MPRAPAWVVPETRLNWHHCLRTWPVSPRILCINHKRVEMAGDCKADSDWQTWNRRCWTGLFKLLEQSWVSDPNDGLSVLRLLDRLTAISVILKQYRVRDADDKTRNNARSCMSKFLKWHIVARLGQNRWRYNKHVICVFRAFDQTVDELHLMLWIDSQTPLIYLQSWHRLATPYTTRRRYNGPTNSRTPHAGNTSSSISTRNEQSMGVRNS